MSPVPLLSPWARKGQVLKAPGAQTREQKPSDQHSPATTRTNRQTGCHSAPSPVACTGSYGLRPPQATEHNRGSLSGELNGAILRTKRYECRQGHGLPSAGEKREPHCVKTSVRPGDPPADREEKKPKPQTKRARAPRETGFCLAECQDREVPLPHPVQAAWPRGDEPSRVVVWVAVTLSNGQRSPPTPTSEAHLGL